ncbi:hypothetical protein PCANC_22715 [Puccinia coronata f. sp. avenae]|uniref:SHSP domain-containing protein n=1 Tax=Puccinia coronata f. sp. avenae TaxID=200324 RepID=A0A2N5S667_9BASI|nr:hypothetical protein PCANC_22715 [Puccinia coronata f. sp. avenae]
MASSDDHSQRLQQLLDTVLAERYGTPPTSHRNWPRTTCPPTGSTPLAKVFTPKIDVIENPTSLMITVELPGAKREDISLDLCRGSMSLSGKIKATTEHVTGNVRPESERA